MGILEHQGRRGYFPEPRQNEAAATYRVACPVWQSVRTTNGAGRCSGQTEVSGLRLWSERISPFHGEASLPDLRRIRRGNAGELRPHVVDDVKIAVWTVVVPQAKIGADALRVRRIHLYETSES